MYEVAFSAYSVNKTCPSSRIQGTHFSCNCFNLLPEHASSFKYGWRMQQDKRDCVSVYCCVISGWMCSNIQGMDKLVRIMSHCSDLWFHSVSISLELFYWAENLTEFSTEAIENFLFGFHWNLMYFISKLKLSILSRSFDNRTLDTQCFWRSAVTDAVHSVHVTDWTTNPHHNTVISVCSGY